MFVNRIRQMYVFRRAIDFIGMIFHNKVLGVQTVRVISQSYTVMMHTITQLQPGGLFHIIIHHDEYIIVEVLHIHFVICHFIMLSPVKRLIITEYRKEKKRFQFYVVRQTKKEK